jgi:AcrR family transcriptional regulator
MPTKRDAILRASLKLFNERGFEHTPTSRIAKEAGVATGTLFHHFKTKEDLINTLFLSIIEELSETINSCIDENDTFYNQFKSLWVNDIRWDIDHPEKFDFLHQFGLSKHISKESHEQAFSYCNFAKRIEQAIAMGELNVPSLEYAKQHYICNVHMHVNYFLQFPDQYTETMVNQTFTNYWHSISHLQKDLTDE